jgi:hypothetical protein
MAASSSQVAPFFRALNTLTLCRVPDKRENLLARVRQGSEQGTALPSPLAATATEKPRCGVESQMPKVSAGPFTQEAL